MILIQTLLGCVTFNRLTSLDISFVIYEMGIITHFVKTFKELNKVSGKFYNTAGYIADTLFIIGGELYLKFYMEKSSVINSNLHGAFTDVYPDKMIIIETQKIFRSQ